MSKIKEIIKKVLAKLHIYKDRPAQQSTEKTRPDFEIATRNMPYFSFGNRQMRNSLERNPKIAIQVHIFFLEVIEEVVSVLNYMPFKYDCYITTDSIEKKDTISKVIRNNCNPDFLQVDVMENRGRDVGPFIQQMSPVIGQYKYIAHLHTKKSKHTDFGDDWRHFLYRNMFGGKENIWSIINEFENNPSLGLIIPEVYPIVRELMNWDNTKEDVASLLNKMHLSSDLPERPMCPVGDIFWARVDAVKPLFDLGIKQCDFQEEAGQLNYTLAHVIERVWCYLVTSQGYDYRVWINGRETVGSTYSDVCRALIYAIREPIADYEYKIIERTAQEFDCVYIASDKKLEVEKYPWLKKYDLFFSDNKRTEIMWSEALKAERDKFKKYDEIAFMDNSLIGPLFDLGEIMNKMTAEGCSMWSLFKAPVSESAFVMFDLKKAKFEEIIKVLENNLSVGEAYVKESAYIGEWLFVKKPNTELCFDYIILHSPFVKKQCLSCLPQNEKKLVRNFFEILKRL